MTYISHNPAAMAAPQGGYSQGLEVPAGCRYLFISGQIPERADGSVPATFEEQCEVVWQNIEKVLAAAGMSVPNLVKVTTYLTDRAQVEANARVRRRHLADHRPALTVMVATTLDNSWLLEIEAIAAAEV